MIWNYLEMMIPKNKFEVNNKHMLWGWPQLVTQYKCTTLFPRSVRTVKFFLYHYGADMVQDVDGICLNW